MKKAFLVGVALMVMLGLAGCNEEKVIEGVYTIKDVSNFWGAGPTETKTMGNGDMLAFYSINTNNPKEKIGFIAVVNGQGKVVRAISGESSFALDFYNRYDDLDFKPAINTVDSSSIISN